MLRSRVSLATSGKSLQESVRINSSQVRSKDCFTITLPDGRQLGYAEYGHPTGYPLLFFHGFPSSRLEASAFDRAARLRRLRLICPDRPGFGLSTFQPHRLITDWPSDIQALTTYLGLSRFAILGGSGGGPYAVACAYSLPKETMSAVGLLASAGPWEAGMKDVPWLSWFTYLAATYTPKGLEIVSNGAVGVAKWISGTKLVTGWLDNWLENMLKKQENPTDLTTAERREKLLRLVFEGFAQGSAAFVQEAQLLSQQWGFKFEDVEFDRLMIWHGSNDARAPIQQIRYMAERLPYCELKEFDEGHFTLVKHLDEILNKLIPEQSMEAEHYREK